MNWVCKKVFNRGQRESYQTIWQCLFYVEIACEHQPE
jgi:hypothetical protein